MHPVLLGLLGLVALVVVFAIYQQFSLRSRGRGIPGPSYVPPLLGNLWAMIQTPWKFYSDQEKYGGISWNSFFGLFIVFSKNTDVTRYVFNLPSNFQLFLTAGAKMILGENNIAFMDGEPHKNLRRQLLPLFQPRALAIYIPHQERVIRKHLTTWVKNPDPQVFQVLTRDLNMETSQDIFCGPYLTDAQRVIFRDLYWQMNEGFLCVPIAFPGSTLWKARKAREQLVELLVEMTEKSRRAVVAGKEPGCLLDVWMDVERQTQEIIPDHDIGHHLLDFLFASQDATTSAMVWIVTLLAEHPEWRQKVLDEQNKIRPNDEPITYENIAKMELTHQFVTEVLRYRPPATMVPMKALKDTKLSDDYTVPAGSVVLPSIWCATKEGYPNADNFEPERFGPERDEGNKFKKHYLVFGYGPHTCLGRNYAMHHLMAFTAILVKNAEWNRIRSKDSDEIVFLPTIFPGDKGVFTIRSKAVTA